MWIHSQNAHLLHQYRKGERKCLSYFLTNGVCFVIVFAVLIVLGIWTLDDDSGISIAIVIVGCLLLLGYVLLFPNSYRLGEKYITVYYGFGIKTMAKWNELNVIEDHYCKAFPWLREYHVGYFKTRFPLWEKACIPKNRTTTALIEKYYKKSIDKFDG